MRNDREQIAAHYKARRHLKSLAPRGHSLMRRMSVPFMREVGLGIMRAYMRLAEQRIVLGLTATATSSRPCLMINRFANELVVVKHYQEVTNPLDPATVSGAAECFSANINDAISVPVQRHWKQLVADKGIHEAVGRCDVETIRGKQSFYGHYVILAARELRQGWLRDKSRTITSLGQVSPRARRRTTCRSERKSAAYSQWPAHSRCDQ